MTLRYLFGPTTPAFVAQFLSREVASGACVPFGPEEAGGVLAPSPADNWDSFCERLPDGWRPDVVVLSLAYQSVPGWLWSAPVPLVVLAADAPLQWHWYRRALPHVERVLADAPTVARLVRQGIAHARPANLFGLAATFLEERPEEDRPTDILFIGNTHPAVQRQRLSWLGRLARLRGRWNVHIDTNVFGDEYIAQLRRARIVFNRSTRGECNRRVFEAAACGALLFQESTNVEVPALFRDRQECVFYNDDNLESLLEYYLEHEDERRAIAAAARARVADFTFEKLWGQTLAEVEADLPALRERARQRPRPAGLSWLLARVWQGLGAQQGSDLLLAAELHAAAARHPTDAAVHNALGLALTLHGHGGGPVTDSLAHLAAGHFQRALACDPGHAVAGLNLAEALLALRQTEAARDVLRAVLALLGSGAPLPAAVLDSAHFPPGFDTFRVEWERAGWDHPGDPAGEAAAQQSLLRWRLHTLLAGLEGKLPCYYEAALARPDLPATRAALGCALGRDKLPAAAVDHLRFAATANPFDRDAARSLFQALRDAGDETGARRVAREQSRLCAAAPRLVPAEKWFLEAPPVGDELASLVILCCNEVAVTRLCLESVLRHTRPPYELILVDNGSTDETPEYLHEMEARSASEGTIEARSASEGTIEARSASEGTPARSVSEGTIEARSASEGIPSLTLRASNQAPVRVAILRNATNLGFARGCNQGLRAARGRYLVLLNNDTVVTPGWLDRLIAWATHDWPRVGMVGAVTNYAPAPQQVAPGYHDLAGLDPFALRRAREFRGQALDFPRLTGFCLLARREVLEQVGPLDEGYGLGFFEDDDLCVRVRDKGYRLLVAQDTYIHHFGSRTFQALGLDCQQMLRANLDRFKAKWGPKAAADYRLPSAGGAGILPAGSVGRQDACPTAAFPAWTGKKSLCMIVRNEEANLGDCLRSALDLFDEAVIVDTGSTDRTREVAASFGPKVKLVDFPWCDSFAAARNESLRHAAGDWLFWLDADDRLDDVNREKLRALLAGLGNDNAAYSMKCVCLPDPASGAATVVDHVRLFRRHDAIRWEYRVHEQILPSVRKLGGEVRWADVAITHTGYQDPALRGRKLHRDLRLLRLDLEAQPDEPFLLFNLGCILQELRRFPEALPALRRSLERSHPSDSIVRKLYGLIAGCHLALGQKREALASCRAGRQHYPDDAELLFREGQLLTDLGSYTEAESCLLRLLATPPGNHFASVDPSLRGHTGRHALAVLYLRQNRAEEARAQWRLAVRERPDFLPAWVGLGNAAVALNDVAGLDEATAALERLPGGPQEAGLLRVHALLSRRDFSAARQAAESVAAGHPHSVKARELLSFALLQEGRDPEAAERALRDVLALDPAHPDATNNLSLLLGRRLRGRDAVFEALGEVRSWILGERYRAACATPSDINEHLPALYELARECKHVTELGMRDGLAALALLWAQPERLVRYDLVRNPEVDQLAALAGRTEFVFRQEDALQVDLEETDLLFIDAFRNREQLSASLRRHADRVRRYIVLPGTMSAAETGDGDGRQGAWPAVEEFLARGAFRLRQRLTTSNGLTVLERG